MQTTNRKTALVAMAAVAAVASVWGASTVRAATFVWDGSDSASNTNWSNGLNYMGDPAAGPSATSDVITFDNNGSLSLNNTVDAGLTGFTFTQLNYRLDDPTKTYNTVIAPDVTLTLGGLSGSNTATFTNSTLVVMPTTDANTAGAQTGATVVISSGPGAGTPGALKLTGGDIMISGRPSTVGTVANDSFAVLDLTQLASFTYTQSNNSLIAVGAGFQSNSADQGAFWGKLILSDNSTININRIMIGAQNNAGAAGAQPVSSIVAGQNTTINNAFPGNVYVGGDPSGVGKDGSAAFIFRGGLTNPVLSIGDTIGNRNGMEIGYQRAGTGHSVFGVLDGTTMSGTSEGELHFGLANLTISAQSNGSAAAGGGFGMVSIDKGTIDVGTGSIVITRTRSAPSAGSLNVGVLNVGLKGLPTDTGAGAVTAGTLTMGQRIATDASSGGSLNSFVNLANDGAITVDRVFVGNNTVAGGSQAVNAVLNLDGGVLTTQQIKAGSDTAPAGTTTRQINFNGGTVKVKDLSLQANLDAFLEGHTAANVYAGGGTIDTNGQDVTINQALVAPAGDGVSSIAVASGGSGYRVAPIVLINRGSGDTTGFGASAVAKIDSTGAVTDIVVTNPGTDYTAPPVVQLFANGGTNPTNMLTPWGGASASLNVTLAPNTSGGITKVGAGTLRLSGNNSYTGATTLKAGTLVLKGTGAQSPVLSGAGGADIQSGRLVLDYTGGTSVGPQVLSLLTASHATNFATGQIRSSTADASKGLGWADDTTNSAVTIAYTYNGDANLDGQVDVTDLGALATNWQTSNVWTGGDFNYDGFVDVTDLGALATNWQAGVGNPLGKGSLESAMATVGLGNVSVPEPASIGLLGVALAAGASARRQRRHRR